MLSFGELRILSEGIKTQIRLPETRFVAHDLDPPYWAPPYTSLLDDAIADGLVHKLKNESRPVALHAVKLQAGKAEMFGGELGRPAAKYPVLLPEMLGGRLLYTNI